MSLQRMQRGLVYCRGSRAGGSNLDCTAQAIRLPLQNELPALRFSEPHGAKQSSPLMPTKAKNTEQATGDCSGLRNDRAIYLDVIELELEIAAIGLSTGEQQPQDERVYV
jgi:hypothetical protein